MSEKFTDLEQACENGYLDGSRMYERYNNPYPIDSDLYKAYDDGYEHGSEMLSLYE